MVSANHCPAVSVLFFVVSHPRLSSLSLSILSNIQLQGCCFAELQNSGLIALAVKARGSSYGLGPMLAVVTLEVTEIMQQNKR